MSQVRGLLSFDGDQRAILDGDWDFFPGDHALADLDRLAPDTISVPGLWEAQGQLDLDGVAWYRRTFALTDTTGFWTLRFGAVMDIADVFLNGEHLGCHDSPFTPFELDPTALLRQGENTIAVRVVDPPVDDPEHIRLVHGKQGWANHHFPSRPSLYMTYGGIWQSVTLRRHGPVTITDVFVNSAPDDLVVTVDIENRSGDALHVAVGLETLGTDRASAALLAPRETRTLTFSLGGTDAARWSPDAPHLHQAIVSASTDGGVSDTRVARYGLRTVSVEGTRLVVGGEPYRMKSVLVQGFRSDVLYAEGTRAEIEEEVAAARAMGFNTLRLHIKAFDPLYLDVCDEVGMLLHCDLPVAEPIAHDEMGADTALAERCVRAVREQVRRDRNHPSIILWSATNELCLDRIEARTWPGYEQFARTLYAAVTAEDTTRPVIENDWVEPDPDGVYCSPILTAHWYGRLHAEYLAKLETRAARCAGYERPLFVTEFGDWGLPEMPDRPDAPFWDPREVYAADLAAILWPDTIDRFVLETQRYQGLSDRLQGEVFRRHDHIGGYCLTELTDVPHELNGLLDLDRGPKRPAVAEVALLNQPVLPMLELQSLTVTAGSDVSARAHVANDGPAIDRATLTIAFTGGPSRQADVRTLTAVPGHRASFVGEIRFGAPTAPGNYDLVLELSAAGHRVGVNRYPIHVVNDEPAEVGVRLLSTGWPTRPAVEAAGASIGDSGPLVVGEDDLDERAADAVREALASGETVVMLAQRPEAEPLYPVPVRLTHLTTEWGSTVFHFTTDDDALPSFPRRAVLVGEDSTMHAHAVLAHVDGRPFPARPVVIAYKPVPGALTGTVVGEHAVAAGRLLLCQLRVATATATGDAAASAVLADLLRWAVAPPSER